MRETWLDIWLFLKRRELSHIPRVFATSLLGVGQSVQPSFVLSSSEQETCPSHGYSERLLSEDSNHRSKDNRSWGLSPLMPCLKASTTCLCLSGETQGADLRKHSAVGQGKGRTQIPELIGQALSKLPMRNCSCRIRKHGVTFWVLFLFLNIRIVVYTWKSLLRQKGFSRPHLPISPHLLGRIPNDFHGCSWPDRSTSPTRSEWGPCHPLSGMPPSRGMRG